MTAPSLTEARRTSQDFVVTSASPPAPEAARAENLNRDIACAWNDESPVLGSLLAQRSALQEAADAACRVRRLRLQASDARARYDRFMADYGAEIGRATKREAQGQTTLAKLAESAAQASLTMASEYLTQALAWEAKADEIERGAYVVLFDGVSIRSDVLSSLQVGE